MMSVNKLSSDEFVNLLNQLSMKSIENFYNPYRKFIWPETLPDKTFWMSRDLISIYGTPLMDQFDEETLQTLSKWESINFYSLNVHGIRQLLIEVIHRIHTPEFEITSDFLHHFIGEENQHMWFFAEFCRRYGRRIYSFPSLKILKKNAEYNEYVENFLVFARILFFEEMVDFYNVRMARDETLNETIRKINMVHHQDEARHIAFGRKLISHLYLKIKDQLTKIQLHELEKYLKRYIIFCLRSFYNPHVYRDAGIKDPLNFRNRVMEAVSRREVENKFLRKPLAFFVKIGIFSDFSLPNIMNP